MRMLFLLTFLTSIILLLSLITAKLLYILLELAVFLLLLRSAMMLVSLSMPLNVICIKIGAALNVRALNYVATVLLREKIVRLTLTMLFNGLTILLNAMRSLPKELESLFVIL